MSNLGTVPSVCGPFDAERDGAIPFEPTPDTFSLPRKQATVV